MSKIQLIPCSYKDFTRFQPFHYWPTKPISKFAVCSLVLVDGVERGFVAALAHRTSTKRPAWLTHRTAVLLPRSHKDYLRVWAVCADAEAQSYFAQGRKFYATAPIDHGMYRDDSPLWRKTDYPAKRERTGLCSHEYIGHPAVSIKYECSACHGTFDVTAHKVPPHYDRDHGAWHLPVNHPDIRGWASMSAGAKLAAARAAGCPYCIQFNSSRSCPAHGWEEKRHDHAPQGWKDSIKPNLPWIDYEPNFLDPASAQKIFDWINSLTLKPETGRCDDAPTHDSIQWGPRQAYLACVHPDVQIQSSGPIPVQLSALHAEIERRYQACFNSIQVNRHWDENSVVYAHSDNMHGDIVMLSLGCPRRFVLRYKHTDKAKTPRWQAGDIFKDEILPSGSLLTIFKRHQFDLTHEMPKAEQPCGPRISLIWRYLTQSVVQGPLGRGSLMKGAGEYRQAQERWKAKQSQESV